MDYKFRNPNTPKLWNKRLFDENEMLLKSPFYIDKLGRIVSFLRNHPGKFLDIGMGAGNLEEKIIKVDRNIEIYGIDISSKAILNAKKKLRGNFYVSDIFGLPFKTSFFDTISILDVLEHVYEKEAPCALREVNRVLKNGGCLMISVPLNENLKKLNLEGKNYNSHLREYTLEVLTKELKSAGFTVKNCEYIYAFSKFYRIKKILMNIVPGFRKPNLLIVYCMKK